ncbi:MAG: Crp/Fnr family transcriptional regulator [Magnetovibrionaceae bacterium]
MSSLNIFDDPEETGTFRNFATGEVVIREGDESREMFVVSKGSARVVKTIGGCQVEVNQLERGDFFGEIGLMENAPRSASVIANEALTVLVLSPGALLVRLRRDPTFAFEMIQQLCGRLRSMTDEFARMSTMVEPAEVDRTHHLEIEVKAAFNRLRDLVTRLETGVGL